jgi:hypothetical protein
MKNKVAEEKRGNDKRKRKIEKGKKKYNCCRPLHETRGTCDES